MFVTAKLTPDSFYAITAVSTNTYSVQNTVVGSRSN